MCGALSIIQYLLINIHLCLIVVGIETNHIDGAEKLLFHIKDRTGDDPEAILCLCRFYEHLLQTGLFFYETACHQNTYC